MTDERRQNDAAASEESPKPVKKRSPVERAIVWGVIAVLLVIVFAEWRARNGYNRARETVSAALLASDDMGKDLSLAEVEAMMRGGKPKPGGKQGRYDIKVFQWSGLFRSYTLRLQVENDPSPFVLAVDSNSDPNAPIGPDSDMSYWPEARAMTGTEGEASGSGMDGGHAEQASGGGGAGSGGSRPRRSFEELDTNGDGRLTREEAPRRVAESFDRIDTNGDGVVDKAELEQMRRQSPGEKGRGSEAKEGVKAAESDMSTTPPTKPDETASEVAKKPESTPKQAPPEGKAEGKPQQPKTEAAAKD